MVEPFHWIDASTVTCSVTNSSADFPFTKTQQGRHQVRIYNAGASTVFIKKGTGGTAATATTADYPLPSGAIEVVTVNNTAQNPITSFGMITASSTATVYITQGEGI